MDVGTGRFEVGNVTVQAENNRGHSMEFWADSAMKRICAISEDAPPHVRQQAEAYRRAVRDRILDVLIKAVRSDRQTIAGALRRDGYDMVATQLLSYKLDG